MASTIRDVAQKAGVSPATVSKAMNQSGAVSEETVKRIHRAAEALDYHPNARARNFATRSTWQIVFLTDFPYDAAFVNPHLFEIIRGVQHALDKQGYSFALKQTDSKQVLNYTEQAALQHQADGFIFHMSVMSKRLSALITRLGIPHVVIGKPDFDNRLCWIDTDNCLSGELAARHLLDRGIQDIAFVSGRSDDMTSWRRLMGVRHVLQEAGLQLPQHRVLQGTGSTLQDGARAVKKLLSFKPRPQAVICANNPIALGFMQEAQAQGLHFPDEMALITFDSYPFSLYTDPPMTVIDINMYDMGQEAGRIVLQKIKHPATQIQSYITAPTLVQRGTT